jgi:hypothetical protein
MSQIKFGHGLKPENSQFYHVDAMPFLGTVGAIPFKAKRVEEESSRRYDNIRPSYGEGAPVLHSSQTDAAGIPLPSRHIYETVMTAEGPVRFPIDTPKLQFEASAETLNFLMLNYDELSRPLQTRDRYF